MTKNFILIYICIFLIKSKIGINAKNMCEYEHLSIISEENKNIEFEEDSLTVNNLNEEEEIIPNQILTVYDYGINVSYYNASILNKAKASFTEGIATKIAYINSLDDINNVDKYSSLYNRRWLFYVNNSTILDELLDFDFKKYKSIKLYGILINNFTDTISEKAKKQKIPIIQVYINHTANPNITVFDLKEFDFLNQTHNTFFGLTYIKSVIVVPIKYFSINVVICFCIVVLLLIVWILRLIKVPEQHVFTLQKVLIFYPGFSLLFHLILLLDVFLVLKKKEQPGYKIYVEVAMITINSIFRTILWFIILLILSGWQIIKQQLNREEMKFFIKMYIIIYIAMSIDPLIDAAISKIGGIFDFSEIKNILLYIVLGILCTIRFRKSYLVLKRKIRYASIVSRNYIPSFLLKIRMIK